MRLWLLLSVFVMSVVSLKASVPGEWELSKRPPGRADAREIIAEADPIEAQSCYSMGQINFSYESGEIGAPSLGLRITDPRGRKFGYDPRVHKGWQELPLAEGFVDCDENEDTREHRRCAAHIQICGPVSGVYKVEVLPTQNGKYSIGVSGKSQETRDETGFHSILSHVALETEIRNRVPATVLLQYSREKGVQIELIRSHQHSASGSGSQKRHS